MQLNCGIREVHIVVVVSDMLEDHRILFLYSDIILVLLYAIPNFFFSDIMSVAFIAIYFVNSKIFQWFSTTATEIVSSRQTRGSISERYTL